MTEWVLAARMSELRRRKKKKVTVGGSDVALFLIDDQIFALQDMCIHKQRSLSKGTIFEGRVICPGHQWKFDPETGAVEDHDRYQPTFPVRVDGDHIYVDPVPASKAVS